MATKEAAKPKTSRGIRNLPPKTLGTRHAQGVKAGAVKKTVDGSLEAGIHFKYDIKGNKEG